MDSRRWVLTLLLLGACKAELGNGSGDDENNPGTPDASTTKQPDAGAPGPDGQTTLGPWGTPAKVPGADTTADEDDSTLSSSRLELYFKRDDGNETNLYVMTRITPNGTFGPPAALTVLNTTVDEESPRLSQDDLTLFFGRNGDIFKTVRTSTTSPWQAPTAVTALNTGAYEKWGVACSNGYAMVSRAVSNNGQDMFEGDIATGATSSVTQLNSTSNEQGTFLSNDCLRVYFQSSRDNGQFDIYVASRATMTTAWSNPTKIPDFNTGTFNEEDAWISPDQRTFLFASNSSGSRDIYIATR
jgi:hypothetical protein